MAGVAVEHRAEHARRVHPRQAEPLDVAVGRDERGRLAVRQERVVGDRGERAASEPGAGRAVPHRAPTVAALRRADQVGRRPCRSSRAPAQRRADLLRPLALDPRRVELGLHAREQPGLRADRARRHAVRVAERGQVPRGLAGVPLHRVEPVGAVGDVRRADRLAGGQQVLEPDRHERPERELERAARQVDVGVAAGRRVQVDAVVADAGRVVEAHRPVRAAHVQRDVLLHHGAQRAQAAGLADVGRLGEPVGRAADDVGAQPQPGPARLRLHPVQEREAQRAGARVPAVQHGGVGVVDLRPVHQRDVARVGAGLEQPARCDPAEAPQVLVEVGVVEVRPDRERVLVGVGLEAPLDRPQRPRVGRGPREAAGEAVVLRRPLDRVVLARAVIEREAHGHRLQVVGLVGGRAVWLAGPLARLEAGDVLGFGERQQRAGLGRVEEPVRPDRHLPVGSGERHRLHAIAVDGGADRRVAQQHLQPLLGQRGSEHRVQDGERDPRLMAEPRHRARAGVERGLEPGAVGQREVRAVVRADPVAQPAVRRRAAAPLDPAVLVRRHGLAGELAAEPVGGLGHHDGAPARRRRQRRGDAAEAAAHDQDVAPPLGHRIPSSRVGRREGPRVRGPSVRLGRLEAVTP